MCVLNYLVEIAHVRGSMLKYVRVYRMKYACDMVKHSL